MQRDPQAIGILAQALNTAGGVAPISGVQDLLGVGTISYFSSGDPVQGSVMLKGRGLTQFRLDATIPAGVRSVVVNNGVGSIMQPDGTAIALPYYQAANMGTGINFPFAQILAALQDSTVNLAYLGLVSHNNAQLHDVRIQGLPTASPIGATPGRLPARDVLIDPSNLQVVALLITTYADDGSVDQAIEIQFSDYRAIGGVLAPFAINNLVSGQSTFALQLTQVSFNNGLSDADFQ